ncbi:MAG: hypothetical protein P4L53_22545 [Candidatus Obscuribacterales bacterium]|nr:hypothetical protein [Candidatus Obscuribacterales bacterium]
MLITSKRLFATSIILASAAAFCSQVAGFASDSQVAVVASMRAPVQHPNTDNQVDFADSSRQAQDVKMRRNNNPPSSQDKIVRGAKEASDKKMILGGPFGTWM